MNASERALLRERLLELRASLGTDGAVKITPNRSFSDDPKVDEDAQPLNEMNQVIASSRNRSRSDILEQIETALDKLDNDPDEYGVCEECEANIPFGRLKIIPYADLCTRCQDAADPQRGGARKHLLDFD